MHANNRAICPKCNQLAQEPKKAREELRRRYSRLKPEKYQALLDVAEIRPVVAKDLLQDCDVVMSAGGTFTIRYSCECLTCGFTYAFHHESKVQ
jgi:hypothetical protein